MQFSEYVETLKYKFWILRWKRRPLWRRRHFVLIGFWVTLHIVCAFQLFFCYLTYSTRQTAKCRVANFRLFRSQSQILTVTEILTFLKDFVSFTHSIAPLVLSRIPLTGYGESQVSEFFPSFKVFTQHTSCPIFPPQINLPLTLMGDEQTLYSLEFNSN